MLCKVQWSGFPIIANLFKGKLLHCEGASSRGGCRAQRAPGRARRAQAVMVAASPRAWLQAASTHMHLTEGWRKDWVLFSPCSSVLTLGTQIAHESWARPGHRNIMCALVAGFYQRLPWGWGASYSSVSPLVWEYFMEEKESTMTQGYPIAVLQGYGQHPGPQEVSGWASTVTHAWLCQPQRQMRKCGHQLHASAVDHRALCGRHLSYLACALIKCCSFSFDICIGSKRLHTRHCSALHYLPSSIHGSSENM